MSETEELPEDWDDSNLGNLVDMRNGKSISREDREGGETPVYGGNGIMGYTEKEGFADKKTLVIGRVGAKCGNVHLTNAESWVSDNAILTTDIGDINERFLLNYLDEYNLGQLSAGNAQDKVTQGSVSSVTIPRPSVSEQRRIASILYSVDEQLKVLHDRHDMLSRQKHGLMQDLLTGNTRVTPEMPVRDEVTDKPSEIEVSSKWSTLSLGSVSKIKTGDNISSDKYSDSGIPLMRISNIGSKNDESDIKRIRQNDYDEENIELLEEDDIVMAMSGSVGKVSKVTKSMSPSILNQRVAKFESSKHSVTQYLYYVIASFEYQKMVKAYASGGVQDNISKSELESIEIPVPPLWEQERIASILYTVDEMIERTSDLIDEYEHAKRGLMQDLLSGDVRTPEDLEVLEEINNLA